MYKTVKYVMILHPVLNQEPQQHINLTVLWCNHGVAFHARFFNCSWAFMIALVISIIFSSISLLAQRNGIWKVLKMWSLQEIVLKLETSRKLTWIPYRQHPKYPLKHIPSEQPLHFLNNCNYIHIQSTDLCTWKLACCVTS